MIIPAALLRLVPIACLDIHQSMYIFLVNARHLTTKPFTEAASNRLAAIELRFCLQPAVTRRPRINTWDIKKKSRREYPF